MLWNDSKIPSKPGTCDTKELHEHEIMDQGLTSC